MAPEPKPPPPLPGLLTVADCAAILRVSDEAVLAFIKSGELPRIALSHRTKLRGPGPRGWRVRREALEQFIRSREAREVPHQKPGARMPLPRVAFVEGGPDGIVRLKRPRGA